MKNIMEEYRNNNVKDPLCLQEFNNTSTEEGSLEVADPYHVIDIFAHTDLAWH